MKTMKEIAPEFGNVSLMIWDKIAAGQTESDEYLDLLSQRKILEDQAVLWIKVKKYHQSEN
jgi:hypothetical protein